MHCMATYYILQLVILERFVLKEVTLFTMDVLKSAGTNNGEEFATISGAVWMQLLSVVTLASQDSVCLFWKKFNQLIFLM